MVKSIPLLNFELKSLLVPIHLESALQKVKESVVPENQVPIIYSSVNVAELLKREGVASTLMHVSQNGTNRRDSEHLPFFVL
jgi:hypothetical protein